MILDKTLLAMSSHVYKASISLTEIIQDVLEIPMLYLKTYAANLYAHHSRVRKHVKLIGSCL